MENELRSGRLIGFIFAVPCSAAVLVCLWGYEGNSIFLLTAFIFGLVALVGFQLTLRPKTLVRQADSRLSLYPGSLFKNSSLLEIPLEKIASYEVKKFTNAEGSWTLLYLHLVSRQPLTKRAIRWMSASVPRKAQEKTGEMTIVWSLNWPQGGVEGASVTMKKLTRRGASRPTALAGE